MTIDPREQRFLAASILASIALHGAALALGPLVRHAQEFEPPRVLSVVLPDPAPGQEAEVKDPPPPPPAPAPPRKSAARTLPRADPPPVPAPAARPETPAVATAPSVPAPAASDTTRDEAARAPATSAAAPASGASDASPASSATPPDFRAAYLRNPPPAYPASARRSGEQGTITLRVLVSTEGLPVRVELERSSGSGVLDSAALTTVKNWRFVPARRGAEPLEAWVIVPIVFRLEPGA